MSTPVCVTVAGRYRRFTPIRVVKGGGGID